MYQRYGDSEQFLNVFRPELQLLAATEWVSAYTGLAPTLGCVADGYGQSTAVYWLCEQLEDLNAFSGVKTKLDVTEQQKLSAHIITSYRVLRVTEIMLFLHRLKSGQYGSFYGAVSSMMIFSSLSKFMAERQRDLGRISEQQQRQAPASQHQPEYITREEYERRKAERQAYIPSNYLSTNDTNHQ